MIEFKKMWSDVSDLLSNEEISEIDIVEHFKSGFVVRDCEETYFVTRDDFVDFWCKILCSHEISKEQILSDKKTKEKYVYPIIKRLPYISETAVGLKLRE